MTHGLLLLGLSSFASQVICIAMVLAVLIGVPYFMLFGGAEKFCRKPLLRRYDGIQIHETPQDGDVQFVYHTYRGFLLWFAQDEHRISAPPNDAKELLGRFLRFNLSYGMLSYGLVFVPFLAIGNFIAQNRSINKQIKTLESQRANGAG